MIRKFTKKQLIKGEKKLVIHTKLENFKKPARENGNKPSKVKNKQQER